MPTTAGPAPSRWSPGRGLHRPLQECLRDPWRGSRVTLTGPAVGVCGGAVVFGGRRWKADAGVSGEGGADPRGGGGAPQTLRALEPQGLRFWV